MPGMPTVDELFAEGNRHLAEGRPREALPYYQQVVAARPDLPEAVSNLGVSLADLGQHDEALAAYERALALRPDSADIHYNRANSLATLNRVGEALLAFEAALRLEPDFAQAWTNRGVLLRRLGHVREAFDFHRRALQLRPDSADVHSNYGLCLGSLGRVEEAIEHYDLALRMQPQNHGARCNRAQLLLLKADFRNGWVEYESRWHLARARLPVCELPRWDGAPLGGKSVLLRHEQGLGDTIMFCRYAALIPRADGRVVLECPKRLHRLLSTCAGIDALVERNSDTAGLAFAAPLLSVPGIFRTDLRSIPAAVPYLHAEPQRVEKWRKQLPKSGLRVGIAWQGNPEFPEDAMRSIPLQHFAALNGVADVHWISLQAGHGVEQIAAVSSRLKVHELGPELDVDGAFVDTAAVMMNLDLIITADTAIVHVAGALARPVWLALNTGPEWRWLRDRDDSPWYPSARLFRQERFGGWDGVFARMRDALSQFTTRPPGRAP